MKLFLRQNSTPFKMPLSRQSKKFSRLFLQIFIFAAIGFLLSQLLFKKVVETSYAEVDTPSEPVQISPKKRKRHTLQKNEGSLLADEELSHSSSKMLAYVARVASFSSEDFENALAGAKYNKAFESALYKEWARRFPEGMFEHFFQARTFPKNSRRDSITMALAEWTKQDPQDAIARLSEIPEGPNSIYHLALHQGLKDNLLFDEVIELESSSNMIWGSGVNRDDFLVWYDRSPTEKLTKVLRVKDDGLRQSYLRTIATHSAKIDPALSIQKGISLPRGDQKAWLNGVVSHVSEGDPAEALSLLSEHTTDPAVLGAAFPALSKLLQEEPEVALEWADQHLVGHDRVEVIEMAFRSNSANDWEKMQTIAANLDPGPAKNIAYSALAKNRIDQVSDSNSTDLAEWIITLEDPDAQHQIIRSHGYNFVRSNLASARLLAEQSNSNLAQRSLVQSVYTKIYQEDPEAAQSWLQTLPERNRRLVR